MKTIELKGNERDLPGEFVPPKESIRQAATRLAGTGTDIVNIAMHIMCTWQLRNLKLTAPVTLEQLIYAAECANREIEQAERASAKKCALA